MSQKIYPKSLIDSQGNRIDLEPTPFAIGGEGALFGIINQPDRVAKLYHKPLSQDRMDKVIAMVASCNDQVLKISSWPTSILHSGSRNNIEGIVMNRFRDFKEIHHLYSNAQRRVDFPKADWGFLVHTARNCAAAFDTIHRNGHVIGDVNQKNVMVSEKGLIILVDCDSFQIKHGSKVYRCEVGVPEYTPPELMGMSFSNFDRSRNHDLFGLAVLIFHLLMMGRHPFSGVPIGNGDIPINDAISSGCYAYTRKSGSRLSPPPGIPPINMIDGLLQDLFEQAFEVRTDLFSTRPTAEDWRLALDQTLNGLTRCKIDPKHSFPKRIPYCPWCNLIASSRLMFFTPSIDTKITAFTFPDIDAISSRLNQIKSQFEANSTTQLSIRNWDNIKVRVPDGIKPLSPRPIPKSYPAKPILPEAPVAPPSDPWIEILTLIFAVTSLILLPFTPPTGFFGMIIFGISFALLRSNRKDHEYRIMKDLNEIYQTEVARIEHEFELRCKAVDKINSELMLQWREDNREWLDIEDSLKKILLTWENESRKVESSFYRLQEIARKEFVKLESQTMDNISKLKGARVDYETSLRSAETTYRNQEIELYLDKFLIQNAKLPAMTYNRILALESFGIETAKDVESLNYVKVPGIGPVLKNRLFEWRDDLSTRFAPSAHIPNSVKSNVDAKFAPVISPIHASILKDIEQMNSIGRTLTEQSRTLDSQFSSTSFKVQKAKVALNAFYEKTKSS